MPCHLRNDDDELRVLAAVSDQRAWPTHRKIVLDRFLVTSDGGYLYNAKLLSVYERQRESYRKRQTAGRNGGLAKASNARGMPEECLAQESLSNSSTDFDVSTSKSNATSKENPEVITSDDATQYVTIELGIGGSELRKVLQEQIFRQLEKLGIQPKDTAEAMVLAWRIYEQTDVEFRKGPVKFFADGSWRKSPEDWKRKSGKTNELLNNLARAKANFR